LSMQALLLLLLAFVSVYLGWVCAALAMPRHWAALGRASADPPAIFLRILAVVCCAASLGFCLARDAAGFGVLTWVCLNSVGAWLGVGTATGLVSTARARDAERPQG